MVQKLGNEQILKQKYRFLSKMLTSVDRQLILSNNKTFSLIEFLSVTKHFKRPYVTMIDVDLSKMHLDFHYMNYEVQTWIIDL